MNLYRLIGIIALGGICFCSCNVKSTSNNNGPASSVTQLRLFNTSIAGWTESASAGPDSFMVMNAQQLEAGSLDGGAGLYTDESGFVQAMVQDMVGPNGEEIVSYVMQYTLPAEAATVYSELLSQSSPIDSIPGYSPKSVAFGTYVFSGNAYAQFGKFLCWMTLGGFPNQTQAFQTASQFLSLYESNATGTQ